jgi:hypothetical protein
MCGVFISTNESIILRFFSTFHVLEPGRSKKYAAIQKCGYKGWHSFMVPVNLQAGQKRSFMIRVKLQVGQKSSFMVRVKLQVGQKSPFMVPAMCYYLAL